MTRRANTPGRRSRWSSRDRRPRTPAALHVAIPGRRALVLRHLVLDYNGTIAEGGRLLDGVAERLERLARTLRIIVLTADTFGTARAQLAGLPVEIATVRTGVDKARFIAKLRKASVCAVGNGANDVAMFRRAALGIAVLGREGIAAAAVGACDVVVASIEDGLDLLLDTRRLAATMRK